MPFSPLAGTHHREAQSLYRRREQLLSAPASSREALRQLDWRLLANLQGAGSARRGAIDESLKPAALFVESWWLLQTQDAQEVAAQLDALFASLDGQQQRAIITSVHLAVGPGFAEVKSPALQAAFCYHDCARALSMDPADCCDEVAGVVLQFLDASGARAEIFRPFYQEPTRTRARRQALIAGLARQDPAAVPVARDFPDDPLLVLMLVRNGVAVPGALGLALAGSESDAEALLEMMDRVETAQEAAAAWFWLSGQAAPSKPRLQTVVDATASAETLPDAAAAAEQWQGLVAAGVMAGESVFFGKARTGDFLDALAKQCCGEVSSLIAAHQAVNTGKGEWPVTGWQHHDLKEVVANV